MADFWNDIPFFWGFVVMVGLAALIGLRAWLLYKNLEREAEQEWDYQVSENMQDLRLNKAAFVRAYTKINAPRGWKLTALALTTLIALSIPAFALIQFLLYRVWRDNLNEVSKMPQFRGRLEVLSDPVLVWQFSIFMSVIAFGVIVVGLFVRQYYKGAPGLMRDALIFERGGFKPEAKLTVGPNPAHFSAHDFSTKDVPGRAALADIFENALGLNKRTEKNWQSSGHDCDIYSAGTDMQIYVHVENGADECAQASFTEVSHPFFFAGEFARHDDKPFLYTLIFLAPNAYDSFEKIKVTGIEMDKASATKTSRHCDFTSGSMEVFIYDERW